MRLDDLYPETRQSLEDVGRRRHGPTLVTWNCGCERRRGERIFLCSFHEGFECGIEARSWNIERGDIDMRSDEPEVETLAWDDEIDDVDLVFECCHCNTPLPDATSDDPDFPFLECGDCRTTPENVECQTCHARERGGTEVRCQCGELKVGGRPTGSYNWNPDCPEHGTTSSWYRSPEQVEKRAADSERLRDLQRRARELRNASRRENVDSPNNSFTTTERRK